MRRVVALRGVEHLEAQVFYRDLTVLEADELGDEGLEVVLDLHEQVCRLLQSDVELTLLAEALFVVEDQEKLVGHLEVSLKLKKQGCCSLVGNDHGAI